jgi:hypothetical protein
MPEGPVSMPYLARSGAIESSVSATPAVVNAVNPRFSLGLRPRTSGRRRRPAGVGHPFIAVGSVITTFAVPGAVGVPLIGPINNSGDVTGAYADASGVYHCYLRTPTGHFTYINDPNAGAVPNLDEGTIGSDINDNNDVVGTYVDSEGVYHGFLYYDGRYTTVDVPGATDTIVDGANDLGVMIGNYYDSAGVSHGFIDFHGFITRFEAPGAGDVYGTGTIPATISNDGVAIGVYYSTSAPTLNQGWMFKDGKFTALTDPKAGDGPGEGTSPNAIAENCSAIDGYYWDSAGNLHSFILDL